MLQIFRVSGGRLSRPPLKPHTLRGDWQLQVWGRFLGERIAPAVTTFGVHQFLAAAGPPDTLADRPP
jgi:hypothetical protein